MMEGLREDKVRSRGRCTVVPKLESGSTEVRAVREAVKDVQLRWSVTVKAAKRLPASKLRMHSVQSVPGSTQPNICLGRTAG